VSAFLLAIPVGCAAPAEEVADDGASAVVGDSAVVASTRSLVDTLAGWLQRDVDARLEQDAVSTHETLRLPLARRCMAVAGHARKSGLLPGEAETIRRVGASCTRLDSLIGSAIDAERARAPGVARTDGDRFVSWLVVQHARGFVYGARAGQEARTVGQRDALEALVGALEPVLAHANADVRTNPDAFEKRLAAALAPVCADVPASPSGASAACTSLETIAKAAQSTKSADDKGRLLGLAIAHGLGVVDGGRAWLAATEPR
jgi:hypothetical protein